MNIPTNLRSIQGAGAALRLCVFGLASLSFACLLGHMYGLWSMRLFACVVFPPAILLLAVIAVVFRTQLPGRWIIEGTIGGILAAVAYDLFRLPFVLNGAPLFRVFSKFGEMLLSRPEPKWLVESVGWTYHFSNGAALGIMFLALVAPTHPKKLFWGAVVWALLVELLLLVSGYPRFFGFTLNARFVFLTVSAHLIFGLALGLWFQFRPSCRAASSTPGPLVAAHLFFKSSK